MTEWSISSLGSVGVVLLVFLALYFAIQREAIVTGKAHRREIAAREREIVARDEREKALAATHAEQIRDIRGSHEIAVTGLRSDYAAQIAIEHRNADDWRGAYHVLSENAKASEDRMDEVVETVRQTRDAIHIIRDIARGDGG